MRDIGPKAQSCFCLAALICAFVPFVQVKAEQRSAPWDSNACNETCRWWMNLGSKPAADLKPPASGLNPALSAKAMVSDADLTAVASPASGGTVMKGLGLGDRFGRPHAPSKPAAVVALLPPERPAFIPGQSLWGVQIQGSAPALPALLISAP